LHPSGFHLVVGFGECVKMMNILNNALVPFKTIQGVKNCKEISFSHGGSYFAVQAGLNINVYKFYTGELGDFIFKGHTNNPKSISWLEDDTGFVSCGMDSNILLWRLYQPKAVDENGVMIDNNTRLPVWEFKVNNKTFNSVAIYRPDSDDCEPVVYASSNDKSIREIKSYLTKAGD
jgi:WD40 repeat protein